jgi:hypothetical protein
MFNRFLKLAASAVNSGNSFAAASKICGIPRRIFRDRVSREGSPLKKLGRNAVVPTVAEKQHPQKVVRLQIGLGLTLNHIFRFAVQICKEHNM